MFPEYPEVLEVCKKYFSDDKSKSRIAGFKKDSEILHSFLYSKQVLDLRKKVRNNCEFAWQMDKYLYSQAEKKVRDAIFTAEESALSAIGKSKYSMDSLQRINLINRRGVDAVCRLYSGYVNGTLKIEDESKHKGLFAKKDKRDSVSMGEAYEKAFVKCFFSRVGKDDSIREVLRDIYRRPLAVTYQDDERLTIYVTDEPKPDSRMASNISPEEMKKLDLIHDVGNLRSRNTNLASLAWREATPELEDTMQERAEELNTLTPEERVVYLRKRLEMWKHGDFCDTYGKSPEERVQIISKEHEVKSSEKGYYKPLRDRYS